ncbi:MAG: hypothetical protein GY820_25740 [Gammaproteobacteria bacterium]|nr:hypothetical protein [Gammaproteobacteria bacterium]
MNIHASNTVERSRGEVSGGVDDQVGGQEAGGSRARHGRVDLGRGDRPTEGHLLQGIRPGHEPRNDGWFQFHCTQHCAPLVLVREEGPCQRYCAKGEFF